LVSCKNIYVLYIIMWLDSRYLLLCVLYFELDYFNNNKTLDDPLSVQNNVVKNISPKTIEGKSNVMLNS